MALSRFFGGVNLFVPGAYNTKNVILTGAAPSIAVGKVAIIGEAAKGRPGSVEILQFSPEGLRDLISEYGSGPIVDAARALVAPSNDSRISQGASAIYVYKTNPSTKSSLALASGWATLSSLEYGKDANLIAVQIDKTNAIDATIASDSTFDATADLTAGLKLILRINGAAANTFTMPAAVTTRALFQTALTTGGNWSSGVPSGVTFTVGGVADATATLTVAQNALATDHQLGYSRNFELAAGSPDLLAVVNVDSGLQVGQTQPSMRLRVTRQLDGVIEDTNDGLGNLGGEVALEVGYLGTTATLSISATQLTTTVAGGAGASLTLFLSNFNTILDLAEYINSQAGYSASVPATANGGLSPTTLDRVSSMGIASTSSALKPGKIKSDYYTVFDFVRRNSSLVSVPATGSRVGLPDAVTLTFMAGAVRGASASSDFTAGLDAMESVEDVDILIPLVSQDASDDISEDSEYTDPSSSYDVESIHVATKTHCKKMSSVKNRRERVCYLGYREGFTNAKNQALSLNSEFCSMLIQDVSVLGTDGELSFKQPHIAAAVAAGMQAGGEIGQPTTKKQINVAAIRHVGKAGVALSLTETFNPKTKVDQAIEKGILPLNNPSSGGVEIVVQNSTYSKDSNFVFNRPSVFSAMNFISKVMRQSLEDKFVGEKNKTSTKDSIEAELVALMADFLRSDIIVGDDTNGGTGYKNLAIRIDGNAVLIDITVTVVQGIDFILADLNVDNIRISA